jgi:hypothetical protein
MSKQYDFSEMAFPCGFAPMYVYPYADDLRTDDLNDDDLRADGKTPSVPQPSAPQPPQSEMQPPIFDINYTQGYLRTQIGKKVKVIFLIGTNLYIDREGVLTEVGISYIILKNETTRVTELCDIYSIKFVQFF